jgi:hypothetical protein
MLPAFQVQVLICTGISGSSPDMYWHFRFKSWYVPAIQVQVLICTGDSGSSPDMYRRFRCKPWTGFLLVVIDLIRKTVIRGVKAVLALRNLGLGKTFNCLVGRSSVTECFCIKHETLSLRAADGGTLVKVLCYKSEGRWFDFRLCHWNFSLT